MSFLSRLKLFLFRLDCRITGFRCRLKGLRSGRDCTISGMPRLRVVRGARAVIGDHVSLLSRTRHNPLVSDRMNIQVVVPGAKLEIASHAGLSGSHIVCTSHIAIGAYTVIGPDTVIYDRKGHSYDAEKGWTGRSSQRGVPISIGEKCYIGMRCVILKGVTIGDHSIVSAGTIVNKDVPAGHIAFGNPMQTSPLPEHLTR